MFIRKRSLTEHPARPEEAQAHAQAQDEAQAQDDAQEDAQDEAQDEWCDELPECGEERGWLTGTLITLTRI